MILQHKVTLEPWVDSLRNMDKNVAAGICILFFHELVRTTNRTDFGVLVLAATALPRHMQGSRLVDAHMWEPVIQMEHGIR